MLVQYSRAVVSGFENECLSDGIRMLVQYSRCCCFLFVLKFYRGRGYYYKIQIAFPRLDKD
jgi:hypothetical protein